MKRVLLVITILGTLIACGPTTGDRGANEDGTQAIDSNTGFSNDTTNQHDPSTDTAIGEHRVDIQQRDSAK
jgi:hypothetical protein